MRTRYASLPCSATAPLQALTRDRAFQGDSQLCATAASLLGGTGFYLDPGWTTRVTKSYLGEPFLSGSSHAEWEVDQVHPRRYSPAPGSEYTCCPTLQSLHRRIPTCAPAGETLVLRSDRPGAGADDYNPTAGQRRSPQTVCILRSGCRPGVGRILLEVSSAHIAVLRLVSSLARSRGARTLC